MTSEEQKRFETALKVLRRERVSLPRVSTLDHYPAHGAAWNLNYDYAAVVLVTADVAAATKLVARWTEIAAAELADFQPHVEIERHESGCWHVRLSARSAPYDLLATSPSTMTRAAA